MWVISEVGDFELLASIEEQVRGLAIAVDQAKVAVGLLEGGAKLPQPGLDLLDRGTPADRPTFKAASDQPSTYSIATATFWLS